MSLSWPTTQTNILLTSKPAPSAAQAHFTIVPQEISCISFTQVLHGCSSMAFGSFILDLHWTVTYSPDAVNAAEAAKAPSVLWLTGSPTHAWATSTSPGHVSSAGWGTAQARAHSWQTSGLFWGQKLCLACVVSHCTGSSLRVERAIWICQAGSSLAMSPDVSNLKSGELQLWKVPNTVLSVVCAVLH